MREIESQEMFVFLSIRPNNNSIPKGLQNHLSSKDSPENVDQLTGGLCQGEVTHSEAIAPLCLLFVHLMEHVTNEIPLV